MGTFTNYTLIPVNLAEAIFHILSWKRDLLLLLLFYFLFFLYRLGSCCKPQLAIMMIHSPTGRRELEIRDSIQLLWHVGRSGRGLSSEVTGSLLTLRYTWKPIRVVPFFFMLIGTRRYYYLLLFRLPFTPLFFSPVLPCGTPQVWDM